MDRLENERAYLLKQAIKEALADNADGSKAAIKEAITEWLNERFMQFGKWSIAGIAAAGLAALAWFALVKTGWTPPK